MDLIDQEDIEKIPSSSDIINKKVPVDVSIDYMLENPYTLPLPGGFYSSSRLEGIQEAPSFLETAKAQAYRMNATAQGINAIGDLIDRNDPLFDLKPDGWTSKTDIDKFVNVRPEYQPALLNAKSPKQQQLILQKIYEEQKMDDDIANGSWLGWLVGGAIGMVSDPMSYIPIAGWVKYGKISSSFIKSAALSVPGGATYGVLSSAAEQMDKVNGNLEDFVVDSFVKTAFSTVLFGGLGAAGSLSERMALWDLKGLAKARVDGIDFKFKTSPEGTIEGYQVIDTTGSLSAAKVSYYEDMAKSQFYKSGVFKLPYVGEGILKLAGMPVFGSPLIKLINSPSAVVRSVVDRVADHNFITTRVAEGQEAPQKFASLMNQEFANLRSLSVQYDALFYERNGIQIKNRTVASAAETALYIKSKGQKALGEIDTSSYVSRETFNDEVQQVLHSGESSIHASVNEAAALQRKQMDTTYKNYRIAYNLPEDWMPPKTAQEFLTRVYDTAYMNQNQGKWIASISKWLKEADEIIIEKLRPITELKSKIKEFKDAHSEAFAELGRRELQLEPSREIAYPEEEGVSIRNYVAPARKGNKRVKGQRETPLIPYADIIEPYNNMRIRLKALEEKLQNELRTNPELQLHVEDWNALSADEAKELQTLLKPSQEAEKNIAEQKKIVAQLKAKKSSKLATTKKQPTVEKAKPHAKEYAAELEKINEAEAKLRELEDKHFLEIESLQIRAEKGEINPRFYKKDQNTITFKNPENRLKFREVYEGHFAREAHAKAYYDTILNQTPEDTINQVMGRFTGNARENPLKGRTLLIPDKVLYDGKFLTNDLMAKVANYTTYLARRTHLKTIFNDVTIDGGFEPILVELTAEHNKNHTSLSNRKVELESQLQKPDLTPVDKKKIEKNLKKIDKELSKSQKDFENNRQVLNHLYDKMMGIQKTSRRAQQIKSAVMSITAWTNLPFVPFSMLTDLSAIGLQHGIYAFIKDGLYPLVESLGTILKTKDSEALRKTAPSIHLALQDVQMGYADRNWSMHTNPYLNLGRFVNTLEKVAHLSTNFTGTNYIDNFLQRITGSVVQSELMRITHAWKARTMSKRDGLYIRKYGIDLNKYGDRILEAFKKNGGGKTKVGGYQSHFWQWEDIEAANVFGDAIFRSIKDTQISAGLLDVPLFLDDNGPIGIMGSFIRGFQGWTFASLNRYVIPSLQQADGEKLLGVMGMLAAGYFVDPLRRIARGEEPFPENLTEKQIFLATINNSGYFSYFANIVSDINLISGDNLLGDLRSDKYKDRARTGFLGPSWGTVNRMADIISALASGEMNENDAKKMARMIPFANASWTFWMSKYLVESLELPKSRSDAAALKEYNS